VASSYCGLTRLGNVAAVPLYVGYFRITGNRLNEAILRNIGPFPSLSEAYTTTADDYLLTDSPLIQ
jgi:hypothetical protein